MACSSKNNSSKYRSSKGRSSQEDSPEEHSSKGYTTDIVSKGFRPKGVSSRDIPANEGPLSWVSGSRYIGDSNPTYVTESSPKGSSKANGKRPSRRQHTHKLRHDSGNMYLERRGQKAMVNTYLQSNPRGPTTSSTENATYRYGGARDDGMIEPQVAHVPVSLADRASARYHSAYGDYSTAGQYRAQRQVGKYGPGYRADGPHVAAYYDPYDEEDNMIHEGEEGGNPKPPQFYWATPNRRGKRYLHLDRNYPSGDPHN
ncbi:hypothetical protein F4677DRAFT_414582 [Hypoxylon crocopeplum]|nr:hypothetical protein F4677DRAFT_414582 [Hypoxylon crocopeplum]